MVETALVLLILAGFMLLSPVLHRLRDADQYTRGEVHREMFANTAYLGSAADLGSALGTPEWFGSILDYLFPPPGGSGTGPAPIPTLYPSPPSDMNGYKDLPNQPCEGRHSETVRYSAGGDYFQGVATLTRQSVVIRPSWAWTSYPTTHTQSLGDAESVRSYYESVYEVTLDSVTVNALQLDSWPVDY